MDLPDAPKKSPVTRQGIDPGTLRPAAPPQAIGTIVSVFRICVGHFLIVEVFSYVLFNNTLSNAEYIREK